MAKDKFKKHLWFKKLRHTLYCIGDKHDKCGPSGKSKQLICYYKKNTSNIKSEQKKRSNFLQFICKMC